MSSPSPSPGSSRNPTLSRAMRRVSRVLKSSSKSPEIGAPAEDVQSKRASSVPQPLASNPTAAPRSVPITTTTTVPTTRNFTNSTDYLKQREEKARELFTKYGMTLSAEEWTSPATGQSQWVEKKIVMRVHRQCHRCQTTFGRDKLCAQCQHTRCKKCPRHPMNMSTQQTAALETGYSLLVDPFHAYRGTVENTRSLKVSTKHGTELVRKQITHRVRRTCHKCSKLFIGKANTCEGCQHQRCPRCPRDPPKEKKWPNGYPGDVPEQFPLAERVRKPVRLRFRWECHSCQKTFIEHEKTCRGCGHDRCDDCPRKPPKKTRKEVPQDLVKNVENKIQTMSLGSRAEPEAS